jgi:hypothetical protein
MSSAPLRHERLELPIEAPRSTWIDLLDRAAEALEGHGHRTADPDSLALELRVVAETIRQEIAA